MDLTSARFAAVILDLDQTLVDSTGALARVWQLWLTEFGIVPDTSRSYHGWTSEDIIRLCLPAERLAHGLRRMHQLETSTTDGIVALPGARRALAELPGHRVAVGTSGTREVARARLAAAGLPVPAVLVSADDVSHGKPSPDIFLAAAHRLGADPGSCLVVEDSAAGLQAARAAGMASLALTTSTPAAELTADAVVPTLDQVTWRVAGDGVGLQLAAPTPSLGDQA